LRRELHLLRSELAKAPDDAEIKRKLDELQPRLIDLLIEELVDQSRDIDSIRAQVASARRRF